MSAFSERVADILADAREYLEKMGWWRKSLRGPNGRQVCAQGAIVFSQGWTWGGMTIKERQLVTAVDQALLLAIDPESNQYGTVEGWNDDTMHGARDKQHVLDTFAKAEKIARTGFDPDYPDKARFDPHAL